MNVRQYPYIDRRNAVDSQISEQQWQQFEETAKSPQILPFCSLTHANVDAQGTHVPSS